ncbi:MAG: hypothetical protein KJ064_11320 [Anaerolineae bacterium]|nr:MAG: hypothetical protein F9K27_00500 [Anaerolineae bacterium]MCL4877243.1 hypothetical protein [Anaerolineae bacterium]
MNEQERLKLAEHLAGMKFQRARSEIRKLDPQANLKYFRNAFGTQRWHTAYELPNEGIKITLVEQAEQKPVADSNLVRVTPVYVEAIVEDLPKRG